MMHAVNVPAGRTPLGPPPPINGKILFREVVGMGQFAAMCLQSPRLLWQLPRGQNEPVLLIPGFLTSDRGMAPMRAFLTALGYDVHGWGMGLNRGDVEETLPQLVERAEYLTARAGRPLRLVGLSLGGYLAREVARERPDLVDQVITIGSPIVGGPKYTAVSYAYQRRGIDMDAIEAAVEARNQTPIRVPITALYTKSDAVVAWRACIDHHHAQVEHIEVDASHLGLAVHPDVFRHLGERLAPPPQASAPRLEESLRIPTA